MCFPKSKLPLPSPHYPLFSNSHGPDWGGGLIWICAMCLEYKPRPTLADWPYLLATVKQHFYAHDKFMRICQNRPPDKFMQFLFLLCSVLCIVIYGAINLYSTNLCDRRLTRIICIKNVTHKFVALWYLQSLLSFWASYTEINRCHHTANTNCPW